jgi:hypothetical protein
MHAKGWCGLHYQRMSRHGHPDALRTMRPAGQTPIEAFRWFMPGEPPDEKMCWDWVGPFTNWGYGEIHYSRRSSLLAHRVSYEIFIGPIARGMSVLHSCDRPICVQPAHLRVGTQLENINDMLVRDRHVRGTGHPLAKLTDDDIILIRTRALSQRAFAERFGVSPSAIRQVQVGLTWRHVV